jgi:hypothetical protein
MRHTQALLRHAQGLLGESGGFCPLAGACEFDDATVKLLQLVLCFGGHRKAEEQRHHCHNVRLKCRSIAIAVVVRIRCLDWIILGRLDPK